MSSQRDAHTSGDAFRDKLPELAGAQVNEYETDNVP